MKTERKEALNEYARRHPLHEPVPEHRLPLLRVRRVYGQRDVRESTDGRKKG